jgi:hypothetical protein
VLFSIALPVGKEFNRRFIRVAIYGSSFGELEVDLKFHTKGGDTNSKKTKYQ